MQNVFVSTFLNLGLITNFALKDKVFHPSSSTNSVQFFAFYQKTIDMTLLLGQSIF